VLYFCILQQAHSGYLRFEMITFLEVTIYWLCFCSETFRRWNWAAYSSGFSWFL